MTLICDCMLKLGLYSYVPEETTRNDLIRKKSILKDQFFLVHYQIFKFVCVCRNLSQVAVDTIL